MEHGRIPTLAGRRTTLVGLLLMAIIPLVGCSGTHLHHPGNLTLAQQAQTSFQEADLSGSVADERERLGEILDSELAVVQRHTKAIRDGELITIVSAEDAKLSWKRLEGQVNARLIELASGRDQELTTLEAQMDGELQTMASAAEAYLDNQPADEDPEARCPLPEQIPDALSSPELDEYYAAYRQACEAHLALRDQRDELLAATDAFLFELRALGVLIDGARSTMATVRDQYLLAQPAKDDPAARCPLDEDAPTMLSSPELSFLFGAYRQACDRYLVQQDGRMGLLARSQGVLGEIAREIQADQSRAHADRTELARLSAEYKKAKKELDDTKAGEKEDLVAKAQEVKKKLADWMETAEKAGAIEPLQLDSLVEALEKHGPTSTACSTRSSPRAARTRALPKPRPTPA